MVLKLGDKNTIHATKSCIGQAGTAIIPCDTIYGLVGKAPESAERIRMIKGRSETKPFIWLLPSAKKAQKLSDATIPPEVLELWPGPLTLIVPNKQEKSLAVRVPDDPWLLRILHDVYPIISTSVNRSGEPALSRISEIIAEFERSVDLIVDGGDYPSSKPSTILDIRSKPYKILRHGACDVPSSLRAIDC